MNPSFDLSLTFEGQTRLSVTHAFVLTAEQTYALIRMSGVIEPETRAGWIEFCGVENDRANRHDPAIRESHIEGLFDIGLIECGAHPFVAGRIVYCLTDLGRSVVARLKEGTT